MLLSTGEQMSIALLAMALRSIGQEAIGLTGQQAGIYTRAQYGSGRISRIEAQRIKRELDSGRVPIIAGFQGITDDAEIVTLGRGASDTTAVALAVALGAERCENCKDVEGIMTADPRIVPNARRLTLVSYEEMLDMAATGGKVLALRSVEFARNHHVAVHVRSSFTWEPGTWVREEDESMEAAIISGVTHDTSEAKVTITGVPDQVGIAARVFRALADESVNVDMIVQNVSKSGITDISFTLPKDDLKKAGKVIDGLVGDLGAAGFDEDNGIARVSLIGAGMKTHPGVAATMFEVLAREGLNIEMISTSTIRISCVVRADQVERAVQALHDAFGLADGSQGVLA
jgi:aspartate kinase